MFEKLLWENKGLYYQDYMITRDKVKNSTAIYKGEPVEFLYQGLFFTEDEYQQLKELLRGLTNILKKVVAEYRTESEFRTNFPFPELMEELILVDPGYSIDFPMGRFDIFYDQEGQHMFCELNSDGSSAMNEIRVIQWVMSESLILKEIANTYNLKGFELFHTWIDSILTNYREFNGGIDDKPNIAIVDFEGEGTIYEFMEFQKRFKERGYQTIICDPRELNYTDGKLFYDELEIKLIYRRATTIRLVEEAENIADFINAYRDRAVCVVGGLVSQIIHNKVLFAVLHDEKKVSFLNENERNFIKNHIPFTRVFDPDDKLALNNIRSNKDRWILKPLDKYAGKGVYAGKDFESSEWNVILEEIMDKDYIYQEYVTVPNYKMVFADDELRFEEAGFLVGLFTYNNELNGLYTRAGRKNIIGAIAESFTVPNYICKKRE
ncbi:MAG: glutathionylspermidine synthase family protein [Halanaerobiales bacterium]